MSWLETARTDRVRGVARVPVDAFDPARASTGRGIGYGRAALEDELERVRQAPRPIPGVQSGGRNHQLFKSAAALAELVAGGELAEYEVTSALIQVAREVGLEEHELHATIRSGMSKGPHHPRSAPTPVTSMGTGWGQVGTGRHSAADDPVEPGEAEQTPEDWVYANLPRLDWEALWADESTEEWIVEPILPARRLVALYSPPKVGKSLLMLEMAVGIAGGGIVLGYPTDRPRRVLYIDFENDPKGDIRQRLTSMGYGPPDLDNLVYLSFPVLAALDSAAGAAQLMAAVETYKCEVVVIDTVSRAVKGEENENDTWLAFYRHTGKQLKAAGVAMIRLDHTGKDETRGQRGGSAKSGDVDAVWRMSRVTDDTYRLDCEANRMQVMEKTLVLHRETTPRLRHRVDAAGRVAAFRAQEVAMMAALDAAGLPSTAGRDRAREVLRAAGLQARNDTLNEILQRRKTSIDVSPDLSHDLGDRYKPWYSPQDHGTGGDRSPPHEQNGR